MWVSFCTHRGIEENSNLHQIKKGKIYEKKRVDMCFFVVKGGVQDER
jgi:hypothetical protein